MILLPVRAMQIFKNKCVILPKHPEALPRSRPARRLGRSSEAGLPLEY
jgi:hypothetical protein